MPLNLSNGQFKIYVGISMNERRCRSETSFLSGVEWLSPQMFLQLPSGRWQLSDGDFVGGL